MSLYIDLLKKCLTDIHRMEDGEYKPLNPNYHSGNSNWKLNVLLLFDRKLRKRKMAICRVIDFNIEKRMNGLDWPAYADTMIGLKRLENIEFCFKEVIKNSIPGDFIETGVWRGGATIFMKGLLKDSSINDRIVWAADSFEGLPSPNEKLYEADKGAIHHLFPELAISIEVVKRNFEKYNLLDENVKFLKGWFKDTLPTAPIDKLAIIRLDGDMYESTMDGLTNLYPKLSNGGFIIIDDWGAGIACQQAVIDYRERNDITNEIKDIDGTGVFWQKNS